MKSYALILYLLLFSTLSLWAEEDGFFGMVLSKKGEVFMTRGIIEFPVRVEDALRYGDEIETGDGAQLQLSFRSSFITIGPNSWFTIEREEEENIDITLLTLEEGAIRSRIIGLEDTERYIIDSESGRVVVTGTDFVTQAGESNFNVSVIKGSVDVVGSKGITAVETLGSLQAGDGGISTAPLSGADVDRIKTELPVPTDQAPELLATPLDDASLNIGDISVEALVQNVSLQENIEPAGLQDQVSDTTTNNQTTEVVADGGSIEDVVEAITNPDLSPPDQSQIDGNGAEAVIVNPDLLPPDQGEVIRISMPGLAPPSNL